MNNLKAYRKQAGYSQADLSRLVGVTQAAISYYEQGNIPALDKCRAIIDALKKRGVKAKIDDVFPPKTES